MGGALEGRAGRWTPVETLLFSLHRQGPVLVLALQGEVDYSGQGILDAADRRLAEHDGAVHVDRSHVPFLDSTGMHFLVTAQRRCARNNASFTVTGVQPAPARALAAVGLLDLLHVTTVNATGTHQDPGGADRYAVIVPGTGGGQAPPRTRIVRRTRAVDPAGLPVYSDATGAFRVTITGDTARPLPGTIGAPGGCLHAWPLP